MSVVILPDTGSMLVRCKCVCMHAQVCFLLNAPNPDIDCNSLKWGQACWIVFLLSFQQVARNQTKSFEDPPPRNKGPFVSERVSRYEAEQKLKAIQTKQEQVRKRRLEIVQKREELLKRSACVSTLFCFGSALSLSIYFFSLYTKKIK